MSGQLEHSASPVNCHYPSTAVCFIQLHCCKESAKSSGGILLYHLFASKNSTVGFWHCDPFHILVFDHTMHAKNSTPLLQERPPLPPTVLFCCPSLTLAPPKPYFMILIKNKMTYAKEKLLINMNIVYFRPPLDMKEFGLFGIFFATWGGVLSIPKHSPRISKTLDKFH